MSINDKYRKFVFSFIMALLMSFIMSFVITVHNMGFVSNIFNIWLSAFIFSFIIALPTILVISPLVKTLTNFVVKDNHT